MKLFLKIVLVVVVIFVLVSAGAMFLISRGLEPGVKVVVNDVDLTNLEDGTYSGQHKGGRWTNEVKVEVKDHAITKVEVVEDVTFSNPEVRDNLLAQVVQNQRVNVDVVAGMTVTCKAYLKAIENALTK